MFAKLNRILQTKNKKQQKPKQIKTKQKPQDHQVWKGSILPALLPR